jgi:quercetin dioxygenase-like cupin family protein
MTRGIKLGINKMLIKTNENKNDIKVDIMLKATESWDGFKLPELKGQPEITMFKVEVPPKTELVMHQHPTMNMGFITKGELVIINEDGVEKLLRAGDAVIESVNKSHYGENRGDETVEIMVVCIGTEGSPLSVYE